jgi:hypothetical protein
MSYTYIVNKDGDLIIPQEPENPSYWKGKVQGRKVIDCAAVPKSEEAVLLLEGACKNLVRINCLGQVRWQSSMSGSSDFFISIQLVESRLFANSYNGWRCELDFLTGTILSESFVK